MVNGTEQVEHTTIDPERHDDEPPNSDSADAHRAEQSSNSEPDPAALRSAFWLALVGSAFDVAAKEGPEAAKIWLTQRADREQVRLDKEKIKIGAEAQRRHLDAERDARLRADNEESTRNQHLHARLAAAQLVRSVALLTVLLVIVISPVLAMFYGQPNISAETFSQFMAPITGLAGTVVGYWFARSDESTPGT